MDTLMINRLTKAMLLTEELANSISEQSLALHNGTAPSNTIGGQFWCVVGARESYTRAIAAGMWRGFACSLGAADANNRDKVSVALAESRRSLLDTIAHHELTEQRLAITFEVLEHETLHHGQLVRYFYANGLPFPDSFAHRYALTQPKDGPQTAAL